jgi:hypothetical protein
MTPSTMTTMDETIDVDGDTLIIISYPDETFVDNDNCVTCDIQQHSGAEFASSTSSLVTGSRDEGCEQGTKITCSSRSIELTHISFVF